MSAPSVSSTQDASTEFAGRGSRRVVAYVMSRFPKLTETFVLDEILELERVGVHVEIFPLWRETAPVMHAAAEPLVARAHYTKTLDLEILRDNAAECVRAPWRYLRTLGTLIWANRSSARYLAGALATFPKAVSFARRMRALGVEHLHAHFASHPAAAAWVVGEIGDIPFSFTAHGSDLHRDQAMLPEKVAAARFVVAISEYNRRFILDHVGEAHADKIRVVHCGVEPERFDVLREHARAGASGGFAMACIGTLHEVKGQRYLLEACAGLSARGIDWRCHLVGDGPDRSQLEALAKTLGIEARTIFHGACDRAGVEAVLGQVDASVAPSVASADGRREGIPVVLMEAAACGLPLVGSRLSGIPEIVRDEDTGLLVEPRDASGLEEALARLAKEPETRARLGAAARGLVEREFRLSHNVERLAAEFFGQEVVS